MPWHGERSTAVGFTEVALNMYFSILSLCCLARTWNLYILPFWFFSDPDPDVELYFYILPFLVCFFSDLNLYVKLYFYILPFCLFRSRPGGLIIFPHSAFRLFRSRSGCRLRHLRSYSSRKRRHWCHWKRQQQQEQQQRFQHRRNPFHALEESPTDNHSGANYDFFIFCLLCSPWHSSFSITPLCSL